MESAREYEKSSVQSIQRQLGVIATHLSTGSALGIQVARGIEICDKVLSQSVSPKEAMPLLLELMERVADSNLSKNMDLDALVSETMSSQELSQPVLPGFAPEAVDGALWQTFLQGLPDIVDTLELLALEAEKGNPNASHEVLRQLHNLKGEFACLGLENLVQWVHSCEEYWSHSANPNASTLLNFATWMGLEFSQHKELFEIVIPEELNQWECKSLETSQDTGLNSQEVTMDEDYSAEDFEMLQEFLIEGEELLQTFEKSLMELSDGADVNEAVAQAFRACHTLKGLAAHLRLHDLREIAHSVENAMDWIRTGKCDVNSDRMSMFFQTVDLISHQLNQVRGMLQKGERLRRDSGLQRILRVFDQDTFLKMGSGVQSQVTKSSFPVCLGTLLERDLVDPMRAKQLLDLKEASPQRHFYDIYREQGFAEDLITEIKACESCHFCDMDQSQCPNVLEKASTHPVNTTAEHHAEDSMRVAVARLDQLIDAIGEAVIAQSMIVADPVIAQTSLPVTRSQREEMRRKVVRAEQVMRQIQEFSMALRMVSVAGVFQKVSRIVRDLSRQLGKQVKLQIEGEGTELDKSLVEHLVAPLIHMARNSMDHGIETTEERLLTGKDPVAKMSLKAYHRAGAVYIEIGDDGKGLNRERILAKAVERGLIPAHKQLDDREVWPLIFEPGFSTASQVTELSGRGVGMDVVRQTVESLRGSIEIESTQGKGSLFTLRLPLTLAIIDGMVVRVREEHYVIPTLSIVTTQKVNASHYSTYGGRGEMLDLRGQTIRMLRLDVVLGAGADLNDLNGLTNVERARALSEGVVVVVEDASGAQVALYTDEILGQQQVVIKNLGVLTDVPGIAGGTIMNDGQVCLILDVNALVRNNRD